jgi:hypothetical protein
LRSKLSLGFSTYNLVEVLVILSVVDKLALQDLLFRLTFALCAVDCIIAALFRHPPRTKIPKKEVHSDITWWRNVRGCVTSRPRCVPTFLLIAVK